MNVKCVLKLFKCIYFFNTFFRFDTTTTSQLPFYSLSHLLFSVLCWYRSYFISGFITMMMNMFKEETWLARTDVEFGLLITVEMDEARINEEWIVRQVLEVLLLIDIISFFLSFDYRCMFIYIFVQRRQAFILLSISIAANTDHLFSILIVSTVD